MSNQKINDFECYSCYQSKLISSQSSFLLSYFQTQNEVVRIKIRKIMWN